MRRVGNVYFLDEFRGSIEQPIEEPGIEEVLEKVFEVIDRFRKKLQQKGGETHDLATQVADSYSDVVMGGNVVDLCKIRRCKLHG
ncbi:hypothetical protein BBF96_03355 [Anoxybacter fermentans]|uniref:Uncharacterized protein n=1 Tax=Anoxybacter fermentans TaxID=1323375 RepID=A0A3S9SW68_9FIRM|nr:hypothetical protein [Anoxybacter fermentans]AZR72502.1 hypothetical protein BBF96_03355 [Anoxybacter fermentans]